MAGVTQVQIDLALGTARITHEGDTTPADLILAIEDAGYEAHLPGTTR